MRYAIIAWALLTCGAQAQQCQDVIIDGEWHTICESDQQRLDREWQYNLDMRQQEWRDSLPDMYVPFQ